MSKAAKKELFDKFVRLYNEIWELEADIKEIVDEAKEKEDSEAERNLPSQEDC